MTAAEHLLAWATPARCQLLNGLAFDRHARRSLGTFSRFLKRQHHITLEKAGLLDYYPLLRLVGYLPPKAVWRPTLPLTEDESSTDLRKWFTPLRRELISRRAVDLLSYRPIGVLNRYLNEERHVTFKIASLEVYYPVLQLVGYVPPA